MIFPDAFGSFVCSVSNNLSYPTLFCSWESPQPAFKLQATIVQAVRATSAAPTFFRGVNIVGQAGLSHSFIDGGIRANNPVKYVLDEARILSPASEIDYVLSLGTGALSAMRIGADFMFKGFRASNVSLVEAQARIATDCEAIAEEVGRSFSDTPGVYYRLSVDRGLQDVFLSEWDKVGDVSAHTLQYIRTAIVEKVDRLVEKLTTDTT